MQHIKTGRGGEDVTIPVVGVSSYDGSTIMAACLEWPAVSDPSVNWEDIVPTNHDTVIDLNYSVIKNRRDR
eukprot:SAG22_NODE_1427_length_4455_cov_1.597107_2_plen_71_part_00